MKVFAPGKLILSGEHAVVHGSPALAMAVNRYVTATITPEKHPQVSFDLSDIAHRSHVSFTGLRDLKERVKRKYHRFIAGDFSIREVLQKPFELAQFAMSTFAESFIPSRTQGMNIHLQSSIPIGCGMGSSAATILSVMYAVSNYYQTPLSPEALFNLALEAENMQHGRSSGLDLRVAIQGGCIYVDGTSMSARPLPALTMYLVNTGVPQTTTGQCVEKVAPHFQSSLLKDQFRAVTLAMDVAIQQQAWQAMRDAIHANHTLLVEIGVVPERVQEFIRLTTAFGASAKVCGAGAIEGDKAGIVMVVTENQAALQQLCLRFGYEVIPIKGEARGVHAV